jgi:hypothetical protein
VRFKASVAFSDLSISRVLCLVRAIAPLTAELTALKEELLSSQKAFEIYRERARVSLKKTATEQKESDEKILQLTDKLKVRRGDSCDGTTDPSSLVTDSGAEVSRKSIPIKETK